MLAATRLGGTARPLDVAPPAGGDLGRRGRPRAGLAAVDPPVARAAEVRAKYAGYIARQDRAVERFAKLETKLIPPTMDYAAVTGLRAEARQKLARFTPAAWAKHCGSAASRRPT